MIAEFPRIIFARVSDEDRKQLDKLAKELAMSPSAVLRLALREKLERRASSPSRKAKRKPGKASKQPSPKG